MAHILLSSSSSILHLMTLLILLISTTTANNNNVQQQHKYKHADLVRRSCAHATYPDVCLRTLTDYPGPAPTTQRDLAQAAVHVSLAHARQASTFLTKTSSNAKTNRPLADCVEQMGDSVDELSRTLLALRNLRSENKNGAEFRWQMSNAETWVSAALTNEDTCLDGFKEVDYGTRGKKVGEDVSKKVNDVARVTSNALYLINLLDQSRGGGRN